MALTFAVDPRSNDMVINATGRLQTVTGAEEVKQRIFIALQHNWKEYFLNVPAGIPWKELILGSKLPKLAKTLIRKTILDVPGVVSIVNLQTDYTVGNRTFEFYAKVEVSGDFGTEIIEIIDNIVTGG